MGKLVMFKIISLSSSILPILIFLFSHLYCIYTNFCLFFHLGAVLFCSELGLEPRASHMLSACCTTELHSSPYVRW